MSEEEDELTYEEDEEDHARLDAVVRHLDAAMKELSKGLNDGDLYSDLFSILRECNNNFVDALSEIGRSLARRR